MSNMLEALNNSEATLERWLKGKTRAELIKIRKEAEKNIAERIERMVDFDDCFVSEKIDRETINIINSLLETKVKRTFKNCKLTIGDYYITIINEFNILIKNDKLGIDVNYNNIGRVTGKGARKYIEEIYEIYSKKVRKFRSQNKWLKEKNTDKYICRTITKMTSKKK